MDDMKLRRRSRAVHGGGRPQPSTSAPEVDPIFASAVFRFRDLDHVDEVWTGKQNGYVYSRMANPGIEALERSIDALEGSLGTVACGSGMAATSITFEALLKMGGKAVSASVVYGASKSMLQEEKQRRGIASSFVDILDLKAVEEALSGGADMLFCESISNPLMEVANLPRLAELSHRYGATFVVDNTFASPMLLRPIEHGADVVIHSLTKYMNGHDDIMGGSVSVSGNFRDAGRVLEAVRHAKTMYGPVLSPFEAWLVLRGMRTLGVRMERHSINAAALAEALLKSGKVAKVYYPGLQAKADACSPAARLLLDGFGGMLSFELSGGREAASKFISALRMAAFVPSLGSYATTISHPGSTSHRGFTSEEKLRSGITDGLIRVSVGLEDAEDIAADFISALESL